MKKKAAHKLHSNALLRIAEALERLSPKPAKAWEPEEACAFLWNGQTLSPVQSVSAQPLDVLKGIDQQRDILMRNTRAFAEGMPANNALLWGARGMGKSSLVKSIWQALQEEGHNLKLIELPRENLDSVPALLDIIRAFPEERILIYCDDLSFSHDDIQYKSLKTMFDGGILGTPSHLLLYATSNRRHLMPRDMIENERSKAISPSEAADEKISLSDRFGLWLGFYPCDQETYFEIILGYCHEYGISPDHGQLRAEAIEWQASRGARSGRVAWQFFLDYAARNGHRSISFAKAAK